MGRYYIHTVCALIFLAWLFLKYLINSDLEYYCFFLLFQYNFLLWESLVDLVPAPVGTAEIKDLILFSVHLNAMLCTTLCYGAANLFFRFTEQYCACLRLHTPAENDALSKTLDFSKTLSKTLGYNIWKLVIWCDVLDALIVAYQTSKVHPWKYEKTAVVASINYPLAWSE